MVYYKEMYVTVGNEMELIAAVSYAVMCNELQQNFYNDLDRVVKYLYYNASIYTTVTDLLDPKSLPDLKNLLKDLLLDAYWDGIIADIPNTGITPN